VTSHGFANSFRAGISALDRRTEMLSIDNEGYSRWNLVEIRSDVGVNEDVKL
jgi:hypothetical protein